jgi:hypothetical protein
VWRLEVRGLSRCHHVVVAGVSSRARQVGHVGPARVWGWSSAVRVYDKGSRILYRV